MTPGQRRGYAVQMAWLIDCYNLLCTTMPPMLAGMDEAGLCRTLERADLARGGVVVVADGSPKPGGASVSPVDAVELVYSGPGRTADDVIIERLRAHTAPRRLTVVSTDRQIRKAAAARRCRVMTSDQFINLLCERLRHAPGRAPAPGSGPGSSPASGNASGNTSGGRPAVGDLPDDQVAGWMAEMGVTDEPVAGAAVPPPSPLAPRDLPDDFDWEALEALERELGVGDDETDSPVDP